MRHSALMMCALALSVLGCGPIKPGGSGIRGQVPVGEDSWAPAPGESICASEHEESDNPKCTTVGRDGSFELPLSPGTYWLCRTRGSCPSLCPYSVSSGEVTEIDPAEFLTPMPDGQGFYGTSTGSFGERGFLDVPHPLRVCVGPPDTSFWSATAELTCVETDRCGRYVISVPEGSYRVLFAERGEDRISDRQRCRYDIRAGQTISIDRVTGRGASGKPDECDQGSTPDPVTDIELAPVLREFANAEIDALPSVLRAELMSVIRTRMSAGSSVQQLAEQLQVELDWLLPLASDALSSDVTLRLTIPPIIKTDPQHIAFPIESEYYDDAQVRVRGKNFFDEQGQVSLHLLATGERFEIASDRMSWTWHEIAFAFPDELLGGTYEVSVMRPDGLASHPPDAVIVVGSKPVAAATPVRPVAKREAKGAPDGPEALTSADIRAALQAVRPAAMKCGSQLGMPPGTAVRIKFSVAGATGEPTKVEAVREHPTDALYDCVSAAAKQASFPKFRRAQMNFTFTFRL